MKALSLTHTISGFYIESHLNIITFQAPFILKEHSVTRPVSVYREDEISVADWDFIVETCNPLGIRLNSAQDGLRGMTWCSCGYQLREKGSRSVLTLPVKGESLGL